MPFRAAGDKVLTRFTWGNERCIHLRTRGKLRLPVDLGFVLLHVEVLAGVFTQFEDHELMPNGTGIFCMERDLLARRHSELGRDKGELCQGDFNACGWSTSTSRQDDRQYK